MGVMATIEKLIVALETDNKKYIIGMKGATKASDAFTNSTKGAGAAAGGLGKQLPKTTSAFRLQKNAAQQLGFQLQDVAVQAQMGTSWFTILGQQGSQLASVMGPGGALVGAAIALAGALGGVLWKAFGGTSEQVEDLTTKLEKLVKSTFLTESQAGHLIDKEKDLAKANRARIKVIKEEMDWQQKKLAVNEEMLQNIGQLSDAELFRVKTNESFIKTIRDLNAEMETLNNELDASGKKIELYNSLINDGSEQTREQKDATNELISSMYEQAIALALNDDQLFNHKLNVMGIVGAKREEALAVAELIEQLEAERVAREENEKFIENFEDKEDAMQAHFDRLDTIRMAADAKVARDIDRAKRIEDNKLKKAESDKLAVMDSSVKLAGAIQNAFFEDNKAIAAGIIVADTAVGIQKSLAIMPFNYANVALIAATGAINLANALSSSKGGGSISGAAGGAPTSQQETQQQTPVEVGTQVIDGQGGIGEDVAFINITGGDTGDQLMAEWYNDSVKSGRIER